MTLRSLKSRPQLLLALGSSMVVALAMVCFYRAQAGPGYPLDDTWIHLAYARTLAEDGTFGATSYRASPGATSPLWVALLALGFVFGAGPTIWPWVLGAVCLGLCGFAASRLVLGMLAAPVSNQRHAELVAWLAGVTVVTPAPLVWSAAGAMEAPLFTLLVLTSLLAFARPAASGGRWTWGVWAGLASLARPEGLLLAVLLAGLALVQRGGEPRLRSLRAVAVCAVVYSPALIFCLATSGRPFPNTFYAKTTALVAGVPDTAFLAAVAPFFWRSTPVTVVAFALALACLPVVRRRLNVIAVAALLGFVLGLPLAYAVMGRTFLFAGFAGNNGRYLYPVIAPAIALGFAVLATGFGARSPRSWVSGIAVVAAALAPALSTASALEHVRLYARNVHDINAMQVAMAEDLRDRFPAGTLVATNDVGALAYLTTYDVLDLIGIVSTETLDALGGTEHGTAEHSARVFELLDAQRPRLMVVFPDWYADVLRRLGPVAKPIVVKEERQNITSGGTALVAFELDWQRSPEPGGLR